MAVSGDMQRRIQAEIVAMDAVTREISLNRTEGFLRDVSRSFAVNGRFSADEKVLFDEWIEIAVRIEALEQGHGWFWRARRRVSLTREFVGGAIKRVDAAQSGQ